MGARCAEICTGARQVAWSNRRLQALHRTRGAVDGNPYSRINALRGFCRSLASRIPDG